MKQILVKKDEILSASYFRKIIDRKYGMKIRELRIFLRNRKLVCKSGRLIQRMLKMAFDSAPQKLLEEISGYGISTRTFKDFYSDLIRADWKIRNRVTTVLLKTRDWIFKIRDKKIVDIVEKQKTLF